MAKVDQEAARQELDEASRLKEKAEELIEAAEALKQEARRRAQDAEHLVAPVKPSDPID